MTNSHNLSPREKVTIDSILSNAEEEIVQTERYQTIRNIDDKCKEIWPEWSFSNDSSPKMIIRSNINSSPSNTKSSISNKQNSQNDYSLNNGSPIKMKTDSQYPKTPSRTNGDHIKSDENDDLNPAIIAQEVVSLKKEVQNLMGKIHNSIRSPELSPAALTIMNKVQPVDQTSLNSKTKITATPTQIQPEIIFQINDEHEKSDINNILNDAEQQNNQQKPVINIMDDNNITPKKENENNQLSNRQKVPPEQLQLPLQSRNAAKLKSSIKQIQNEIRQLTQENIQLRKQLKEIKAQYSEARKEVKKLESNLSRNEAIKMKMMQNYGKMIYQPTDNDVVNTF